MHGEYKVPGGKLVVVDLDVVDDHVARVQVSGDFFLEPDSALDTIDAALHGLPADASEVLLAAAVRVALGPEVQLFGITPEAVAIAVRRALDAVGETA
jgi:lipoate-protein ligase A